MRLNLKVFRISKGLTQDEMAEKVKITRTTYCNIETGKSGGSALFWYNLKTAFPEIDIEEMMKTEKARAAI